jgi:hypothetical protein
MLLYLRVTRVGGHTQNLTRITMTKYELQSLVGIEEGEDYGNNSARTFEEKLANVLEHYGKVHRQVKVANRGDGRGGRIDIVFETTEGQLIPIEIDWKTPRQKSIFKVQSFAPVDRFVLTRAPFQIFAV